MIGETMHLTVNDRRGYAAGAEGECCERDTSRPNDTQHLEPMLPKVAFSIVSRLARDWRKTTRASCGRHSGRLSCAARAGRGEGAEAWQCPRS